MDLPDVDGPHTPESTTAAAETIAELVRYLNHATLPHRAADALPYPADVARLLGHLGTALERLPQLLNQLGARLTEFTGLPLTMDDHSDARRAVVAASNELRWAKTPAEKAAEHLDYARHLLDQLAVED